MIKIEWLNSHQLVQFNNVKLLVELIVDALSLVSLIKVPFITQDAIYIELAQLIMISQDCITTNWVILFQNLKIHLIFHIKT